MRGYWPGRASNWTDDEVGILRRAYEAAGPSGNVGIDALAKQLGRVKSNVSRKARSLGLTRRGRPQPAGTRELMSASQTARIAARGHPRGMAGKSHTPEARARMSVAQLLVQPESRRKNSRVTPLSRARQSAVMSARLREGGNVYSRCKHGRRADLDNQFFRSAWEANYARFLNLLKSDKQITSWEYEADTFWFEAIRRGVRSYTPDFRVTEPNGTVYYAEVKGWMDPKSKTKIKRMKKYHPHIDLRVIDAKAYNEISRKLGRAIPGWE